MELLCDLPSIVRLERSFDDFIVRAAALSIPTSPYMVTREKTPLMTNDAIHSFQPGSASPYVHSRDMSPFTMHSGSPQNVWTLLLYRAK